MDVLDFHPYFFVLKKPSPSDTKQKFFEALSRLVSEELKQRDGHRKSSKKRKLDPDRDREPEADAEPDAVEGGGGMSAVERGGVVSVDVVVGQSIMYYRGALRCAHTK